MNKYYAVGNEIKSLDFGIRDSWDFVEAMKEQGDVDLYARVAAVYRAANLTADAIANMPFALMKGDNDIDTSADWKNVIGVMPNPRELIRLWRMSLFHTNTAYARVMQTNSVKKRLVYVAPQTMDYELDKNTGALKELQRKLNGIVVEKYKPDDKKLFYAWRQDYTTELLPSPNTEFRALSSAAGILAAADYWTQNYFKRGAVKPTVLAVKGMVAPDKKDELQKSWGHFVRNIGRELAKIINAESMDVKQIGDGLGDIKDTPVYKQAIENIAMASGMPLSLLLSNSANYATAQSEYASWFRDSITPWAYWLQEQMNDQIFMPAGYYFEFRPETAEPSQQEEVERANAYATYINAGMLPSVAAQIVGIDLPAGMEYEELDPEEQEEAKPEETPDETTEVVEEPEETIEEETKAMTFEAWAELDIWKRKATKAEKKGDPFPADFVCKHIPADVADGIRATQSFNIQEVKAEPEVVTEVATVQQDDSAIKELAAALNRVADVKPKVKAEPQPIINITMPAISLTAQMPEQQAATVTVNVPEQPAPIVTVEAARDTVYSILPRV